ncbi:sulfotransferase [Actinoallomurus sp. NBC_01490]|uniref:hypothetical protein n=1 Tax=Actinoallomurus sp. NBC_01490 TaxID=2903557 RepID=UPI002E34BDD1|nr:hypothetical protein [Actinoallomurus sp. NBC_01490]
MSLSRDPVSESDGAGAEPVFLLAPARSYSTVAVALLSGHPDVYGFPETLVFTAATVGELIGERAEWARFPLRLSGLWRAVADLHEGGQDDDAVAVPVPGSPTAPSGRPSV